MAITESLSLTDIKRTVLYEVARHSFAGDLEEARERIPYEMIPGSKAIHRCCVYREREIVRQRIRLAEGKSPTGRLDDPKHGIVRVLEAACADCPIQRFSVTDNCQHCLGRFCQQACRFGAISMDSTRAHIDPQKCKECGMCAKACPYNAIADLIRPCKRSCPVDAVQMDEYGIADIDESKCISCGACTAACPFGAISSRSFIVDVINEMKAGKKVVAMVAPAIEGQLGTGVTMASLAEGLKELGFTDMVEVALGGDMTAASEAAEWAEAYAEGKKMTTSCCPAFVEMVRKHFPQLMKNVSTTISPMCAVSRMLKDQDPETVTVFIGPCIAKKKEVLDFDIEGNADYALTIEEVDAMLRAKEITLKPGENSLQQGSVYGKRFGNSGGVTNAVLKSLQETHKDSTINVRACNGAAECKKALLLLKINRLPEDFLEGMACPGGCVGGPGSLKNMAAAKKDRDALIAAADDRGIIENLKMQGADQTHMHRS